MTASPADDLDSLLDSYVGMPGGLLPALHSVQRRQGHVSAAAVDRLAAAFNLSSAEVHGVVTFYKDFRTEPAAGAVVQVCRAEACQARGAVGTFAAACETAERLTIAGSPVEVDEVFCLGNCALGPSMTVPAADGTRRLLGGVDPGRAVEVVSDAASNRLGSGGLPAAERAATTNGAPPHGAPSDTATMVYVPRDAAARAAGADAVADAFAALPGVRVVRNGSRGMLWLEPMVEVVTPAGRIAYGPVTPDDAASVLAHSADGGAGGAHPLHLGTPDGLRWMVRQQRVTFARVGVVDPRSADDYEANGGIAGLRAALAMGPAAVVAAVADSGLRGRGGAAFPTGIKWKTVADAPAGQKYVVANADEGDSGTFADRMLMEGDPFSLIEGMTIAAYAVGATEGFVYVRSEYPDAIVALEAAIAAAEARGWLGDRVLGDDVAFHLHVREGAGAYICGEETAMLESLEGRRGVVRAKPPLPALEGLFGKPTVVNNVLTLATVPAILAGGAEAYAAHGTGRSRGTQVFQLAGNIARGGIVELPFGVPLGDLVNDLGGGTASGRPVRAVQVGGPLGSYLPVERFDLTLDYETFAANDALVGHGGVVVFDDTVDMAAQARFAMEFCAIESCGKCTPCRIGSTRGVEVIDKIVAGVERDANLAVLQDLCEVMADASLCAMGGLTPLPVRSALSHFTDDFRRAEGANR